MKRLAIILFVITCLFADNIDDIPILRWVGPPGSRPGTMEEWLAEHPYTPFYHALRDVHYGDGRLGNIAILTEQDLVLHLGDEIDQLCYSLTAEGYTVFEYELSGGTPDTLRDFLTDIYDTDDIEGALFIGDLPIAWFEIIDFDEIYAQFPIDLFYMDLDGTWLDTMNTGNGRYDGHTGNTKPEIYVGRLLPTGIGIDTVVLRNYFTKNNGFRTGTMNLPERALVFVDDDWIPWAYTWANDVAMLFPDTNNFWDAETTRATVYRRELDSARTWVSVFAHSSPNNHSFKYNNGLLWDNYWANEYITQNPPTNFYNFFACSFSRYTQSGYGGGRAIFNETHGIGSIGSTKTGSMLDFRYFYRPLGQGANLGEAYKYWFECIYDSVGMTLDRVRWHYGMTLLGDPFLKPTGHSTQVAEHISTAIRGPDIVMNNPVTDRVTLTIDLGQTLHVSLTMYDCLGRYVGTIHDGILGAGTQRLSFRPVDQYGSMVPSGVYLVRVKVGTRTLTRKLIKI
ncbi:MAG: T9SS type A sorting domain-containing protein [candidate division WOR-3 bacterium]|nr:MAG: T9SS type A sorting domain-containing protein [candidate division WOR-3 bacterium]